MRPGLPMLVALFACAAGSAAALVGTPAFPFAASAAAISLGAGLLVLRVCHSDPALFLLAQPSLFLTWEISPLLTFLFEAVLASALLFSMDLLHTKTDIAYSAVFFLVMGCTAFLLSGQSHVFFPLAIFVPAAGLACLVILGLAYGAMVRAGGGTQ